MSLRTRRNPDPVVLRTAAVWGKYLVASRDLKGGQSLRIGDGPEDLVGKPDGSGIVELPIRSSQGGWELDPRGSTGGVVYLRGRAENPRELGESGASVPIVAGDYGVLQYGALSVFFQFSTSPPPPKSRLRLDASLLLAFLFAIITLGGGLMLLYLLFPYPPLAKPLELTSPEELKVRYHFSPPRPDEPEEPAGKAEEGAAGKKSAKRKSAAPKREKAPPSRERATPSPRRARPGLSAVTDVVQGQVGKEVLETLGTISSVADALGGLKSSAIVLGGGASGGLRGGQGKGPGGSGGGSALFGAGTLDTGSGAGAGRAGRARGRRGRGQGLGGSGEGRGGERRLKKVEAPRKGQGLSREQISRVVRKRAGAFQACYESSLARDPNLRGGVTIAFSVTPDGRVSDASVRKSSIQSRRVEGCVLRMFRRLRFPAADKGSKVDWPLVFGGKK